MSDGQNKDRPRVEERRRVQELLSLLRSGADLRRGKVRRLRRSIRSRTYENDLKLTIALERLTTRVNDEIRMTNDE